MIQSIFENFDKVLFEVATALLPLFVVFLLFQMVLLKLPKKKVIDITIGFILSFFGLAFFLQGVHFGFLPIGQTIGEKLGSLPYKWIIIPIGFIIGFFTVYAEPAVSVLIHQVEKVSGGYIPQKFLLYALSIGVGLAISLSAIRILFGLSLWYFVIPGYIIAFIMIKYVPKTFISIAFDSGGVATGPMTATFILALFVGLASVTDGRDPLLDGFGMVALVALAPILSVLTLGTLYGRKEKELYGKDCGAEINRHDR
ncbi:DUF1538 domain-containing protein [Fervidibacillus halotolerans]|uniref:DUF1538 domain-containing protein n=1 Tax=Fervidibacillus halotolerans TaxID=2980027 RepID=A0A9E8M217_9BACI|nr:DUF1538 domain-containing protein [Fervidibacillus halotolerans]WAA13537.1 DUF1538 domain-containing protein [Fervidibacillus halotolerans]